MNPASHPTYIPQQAVAHNLQLMSHMLTLLDQIVQARARSIWAPKLAREFGSASIQTRIAKLRALSDNPADQLAAVNELLASFDFTHDLLIALFPDLIQQPGRRFASLIRRAYGRLWLRRTYRSGSYAIAQTMLPDVIRKRDEFMQSWLPLPHETGNAGPRTAIAQGQQHQTGNPAALHG